MNLVLVAALIAVCGADKLDRTYLPPPSAKTAGGSPGSLQAPFTRNSNQGLGGIPIGGYSNDFQGVVVDAAAPGTRASGPEASGLGGPRIAYGSTDSKVGDAAFKSHSENKPGNFGGHSYQDNRKPERIQAPRDRVSNTVRYENGVSTSGFNYAFETDNGIVAEENGITIDGVQAQGGFAYTGDDGKVYSVTYTADGDGYKPNGAHLPTPPPIPEEILKSLEQNAKDEASGVIDDGSYDAEKYNTEDDYTKTDTPNEKYHDRRPAQYGNTQADGVDSGSFINHKNQGFGISGSSSFGQKPIKDAFNVNGFASGTSSQKVPQGTNFGFPTNKAQIGQRPGFNVGSRNEYLPPSNGFNANSRPTQNNRPQGTQNGFGQVANPSSQGDLNTPSSKDQDVDSGIPAFVPLSQQKLQDDAPLKPQSNFPATRKPSFVGSASPDKPHSNTFSGSFSTGATNQNGQNNQPNGVSGSRYQATSGSNIGSKNEYLPPQGQFGKPTQGNQGDLNGFGSQFNKKPSFDSQSGQSPVVGQSPIVSALASVSQSNFGGQTSQYNGFQQSLTGNGALTQPGQAFPDRHSLNKEQTQFGAAPTSIPSYNRAPDGNGQSKPFSFAPNPTLQPQTELTTPLETNSAQNKVTAPLPVFDGPDSETLTTSSDSSSSGSPSTLGSSNLNSNNFPQVSSTLASASSFPSLNDQLFTAGPQSTSKPGSPGSYANGQFQNSNKSPSDGQYSSSTQRPSFSQLTQEQGPDHSYYYRQPSKPFNIPTGRPQISRFPDTPFGQPNRVTPPSFSGRPQSPTLPDTSFTSQVNTASTRYPSPSSFGPISPTLSTKPAENVNFQSQFNRVTQGSFPSTPTVSTSFQGNQFGQIGSSTFQQPNQQLNDNFPTTNSQPSSQSSSSFVDATASSQSPQSQNQGINRISPNTKPEPSQGPSQSPSSLQYDGEIYDYKKPPQVFPASQTTTPSGQFGQKPQFGSSNDQGNQSPSAASNGQFGQKPQFGSPSYSQGSQTPSGQFGQKPQFGLPSYSPGSQSPSAAPSGQFGQKPQFGSPSYSQGSQSPSAAPSGQFGQNPQNGSPFNTQGSQSLSAAPSVQFGQKPQFGSPSNSQGSQSPNLALSGQFGEKPQFVSPSNSQGSQSPGATPSVSGQKPHIGFPTYSQGSQSPNTAPSGQFGQSPQLGSPSNSQGSQSPSAALSGQFGQKPQFGLSPNSQNGQSSNTGVSEQFGQTPQFGYPSNTQGSQFSGAALGGQFGQKPQFESPSDSQTGQTPSTGSYNAQFGVKPQQSTQFGQQNVQTSQPQTSQFGQTGQFGLTQSKPTQLVQGASKFPPNYSNRPFGSSCCKSTSSGSHSQTDQRRPINGDASPGVSQDEPTGSEGSKPVSSVSTFAGVGENFGGPRKPPSFDESGYHY